jgi:hypothetical protein
VRGTGLSTALMWAFFEERRSGAQVISGRSPANSIPSLFSLVFDVAFGSCSFLGVERVAAIS